MTFSQKLYQSDALDIAEEFEPPINANSLEEIKKLLDKVEWIEDISTESETSFLRNQIAKAFGVRAGFAVLVLIAQ